MSDELNLSNLKPAQPRKARKRDRPRPGLGQGPVLGSRDQGPEVPRRLAQDAGRLRGRPDADRHARRKAAREHVRGRDAHRALPHVQPARQRRRRSRSASTPGADVTLEALKEAGLIAKLSVDVKVLGEGELTKKLSVTAHSFSKSAVEKIEAAGGTVTRLREPVQRKKKRHKASAPAAEEPRDRRRGDAGARARRPSRPTADEEATRVTDVLVARERLAGTGASPARHLHRDDPRDLPPRVVDSRAGRRLADDRGLLLRPRRHDPRPAEHLLRRRALAVLPVRARDHAVRHGVDHHPADDGRHPASRRAAAGRRGRLREDHAVHEVPHRDPRSRAGDGVRTPLPQPGCSRRRIRKAGAHHRLAHRRHGPAHVDGRAHHEARYRERDLDPDLRVDPRRCSARHRRLVERRPDGEALLPAHRGRHLRRGRVRAGRPAADPRPVRQAHGGPQDDRRRLDLPAVAGEHGRRHPDHLRRGDPRVPAHDGPVLPGDPRLRQRALPAGQLDLPLDRGLHDRGLHVLLHGGPVQPGRPGRQPAQVRRLHPGHPPRPSDGAVPRPCALAPDAAGLALPRRQSRCSRACSSPTEASRRRARVRWAERRC